MVSTESIECARAARANAKLLVGEVRASDTNDLTMAVQSAGALEFVQRWEELPASKAAGRIEEDHRAPLRLAYRRPRDLRRGYGRYPRGHELPLVAGVAMSACQFVCTNPASGRSIR